MYQIFGDGFTGKIEKKYLNTKKVSFSNTIFFWVYNIRIKGGNKVNLRLICMKNFLKLLFHNQNKNARIKILYFDLDERNSPDIYFQSLRSGYIE